MELPGSGRHQVADGAVYSETEGRSKADVTNNEDRWRPLDGQEAGRAERETNNDS